MNATVKRLKHNDRCSQIGCSKEREENDTMSPSGITISSRFSPVAATDRERLGAVWFKGNSSTWRTCPEDKQRPSEHSDNRNHESKESHERRAVAFLADSVEFIVTRVTHAAPEPTLVKQCAKKGQK